MGKNTNTVSPTVSPTFSGARKILIPFTILFMLSLAVTASADTHTSTAELQPEWSPANQHVDYTVKFCKTSGDTVNEVRIYQNYEGSANYTNFECSDKAGWEKLYISTYPACFYVADIHSPAYNPLDVDNECAEFNFSAHTPAAGPQNCNLSWKFETRDVSDYWQYLYDTTSVDDKKPTILKTITGPQSGNCPPGQGQECWLTQSTEIKIDITEQGDCTPSGLDYCKVTYTVDGGSPIEEVYKELDGETSWTHSMKFKEDSVHVLTVECKDRAGNLLTDTETFRVDTTPPTTAKSYGTPSFPAGINSGAPYPHWITTQTPITLTPIDGGTTCAIGVDKTWYINLLVPEEQCRDETKCVQKCANPYTCESCKNTLITIEWAQKECAKKYTEQSNEWKDCVQSTVHHCCDRQGHADCPMGVGGWCDISCIGTTDPNDLWMLYKNPFTKNEESCHLLQFFSVDKLGNVETMKHQCVFVEDKPPVATKTVGNPKVDDSGVKFTTSGTGTAGWSNEQAHSGAYSVKMTTTTSNDQGRATLPFDGKLSDITSFSYQDYTINGGTFGQLAIWASIYLDSDDDGAWDYYIQAEPYYTYGAPTLNTWLEYDAYNMKWESAEGPDCPHSAPTLGDYISGAAMSMYCPNSTGPFASREYGSLKIIKIDMRAGYGGPWPGFIGYTDDVVINDQTVLSEPSWWVRDHVTPITLTCTDQQPHPVDYEKVCFRVSFDDPQTPWLTAQYCSDPANMNPEGWCCEGKTKQIIFAEDSVHDLEYYCIDALGNKSATDLEYFKVDSQPPSITKTMIGTDHLAKVGTCPPSSPSDQCYVRDDGKNGVHIAVSDGGAVCAVDQTECKYKLVWDTNEATCKAKGYTWSSGKCIVEEGKFYQEGKDILFKEDSTHTLTVNCADALGNAMTEDIETFLVDSTPPVTTKTYGTPTVVNGNYRWITSATPITLTATDAKVGVKQINYRVTQRQVEDALCIEQCQFDGSGSWNNSTTNPVQFTIPEQSCHLIEFFAEDLLGNIETTKKQCVFVDNTPPVSVKTVGEKKIVGDGTFDWWVTQGTPITLDCTDQPPHPVDHETVCYKVALTDTTEQDLTQSYCTAFGGTMNAEGYCCNDVSDTASEQIHFLEDSKHSLKYLCKDALGNTEATVHEQKYKVDTTPPIVNKVINEPYYGDCPARPKSVDKCFVDTATKIDLEIKDGGEICAVGGVECRWRYTVGGGPTGFISDWNSQMPIMFPEECEHVLEIECKDSLGNLWTDTEVFLVDKTPPVTTKIYGQPFYSDSGKDWITSNTPISLTVNDAGPHKSGVKETKYRLTLLNDNKYCESVTECKDNAVGDDQLGGWKTYTGTPFSIAQQSCHLIEYYSKDNVEKTETVKKQCVFVDNTAPTPVKIVGEPKDIWTPGKDGDPESYFYPTETANCWTNNADTNIQCWEVTTLTPISMDCVDPTPHPVDHETVCFNVELDGQDKTKGYCNRYHGTMNGNYCCLGYELSEFYFKEDSEHNLKYYCADALGNSNVNDVDEEKFKVEGTKFEIPLYKKWNLISVPFRLLSDAPGEVFKDTTGVKAVWAYDGSTGNWLVWTPDASPDSLNNIEPGWGYWVMETLNEPKDCSHGCFGNEPSEWLTLGGSLFETGPVAPPSRELVKGWNLIGYYGSNWEKYDWSDFDFLCEDIFHPKDKYLFGDKVYCALNSLVDTQEGYPRWSSLWSYLNCGDHCQDWVGLNACSQQSMFKAQDRMYAGRGYWIEMDVPDQYAPATTCIWNSDFECRQTSGGII